MSHGLERLYTVKEVAGHLGLTDDTVRRLIQRRELEASKVGHDWRIPESGITDYLERNRASRRSA